MCLCVCVYVLKPENFLLNIFFLLLFLKPFYTSGLVAKKKMRKLNSWGSLSSYYILCQLKEWASTMQSEKHSFSLQCRCVHLLAWVFQIPKDNHPKSNKNQYQFRFPGMVRLCHLKKIRLELWDYRWHTILTFPLKSFWKQEV